MTGHADHPCASTLSAEDEILFAFQRNLIVAASAGTGKTYRLTGLYVLLTLGLTSLGNPSSQEAAPALGPAQIIATTFSRAAATEIRARVDQILTSIARYDPEHATALPLHDAIVSRCHTLGKAPEWRAIASLANEARRALTGATIDTIHGLAGKIVRELALDLGLSPTFTILEEDEATNLVEQAVDEVLTDALRDHRKPWAERLVDTAGGVDATRGAVTRLLSRLDEEGVWLDTLPLLDEAKASNELAQELLEALQRASTTGSATIASLTRELLPEVRALIGLGASTVNEPALREQLMRLCGKRLSRAHGEAQLADLLDTWGKPRPKGVEALSHYLAVWPRLAEYGGQIKAMLAEIALRRSRELARRNALGFGDLLRTARDALRDRPELGKGLCTKFSALLIDEFQDTSPVQRDLIYLLHEDETHRLARRPGTLPGPADLRPAGLFLVGDRKQSIYGFRGADVTLFQALTVSHQGTTPSTPSVDQVALRENYRSTPSVLDFINLFCTQDMSHGSGDYAIRYTEDDHLRAATTLESSLAQHPSQPQAIEILEDDEKTPPDALALLHTLSRTDRLASIAAHWVAHRLAERRYEASDIAVLGYRHTSLQRVSMALARLGVPFVMTGRGLLATREVRDLLALLRLLIDPSDRHALAAVLRGPWVGLSDAALVQLSLPRMGLSLISTWESQGLLSTLATEDQNSLNVFVGRWRYLRTTGALQEPPAVLIRTVLDLFDFEEVLACLPRAATRLANVDRFHALAAKHGGNLAAFVRSMMRRADDDEAEDEAALFGADDNAVRLLTIHASKGLEFPVVLLLDLATKRSTQRPCLELALAPSRTGPRSPQLLIRHRSPQGDPMHTPAIQHVQEELDNRAAAERRRLSYVAFTRAKRTLALVLPLPQAGERNAGAPAATLRELLAQEQWDAASVHRIPASTLLVDPPRDHELFAKSSGDVIAFRSAKTAPSALKPERITLAATTLSTYAGCPRRFQLSHLLGFDEHTVAFGAAPSTPSTTMRPASSPPTTLATEAAIHEVLRAWPASHGGRSVPKHIVLQALRTSGYNEENAYIDGITNALTQFVTSPLARELSQQPRMLREAPFTLGLGGSKGSPLLVLRGTIHLLVFRNAQTAWVIDFTYEEEPLMQRYDFHLRIYALAALHAWGVSSVQAGILFLKTNPTNICFLDDGRPLTGPSLLPFEHELVRLASHVAHARATGDYPSIPAPECRKLGCQFLSICHPETPRGVV